MSRFSIKFLRVTSAGPDHIQKIESQFAADGKKNKGSSFQDTERSLAVFSFTFG